MDALCLFPESEMKLAMQQKPDWFYRQSGVIPFRMTSRGLEVLLVTSRRRKHWVIPKGIIEPDLTPASSACQEAWEEAGAHGQLYPEPVGSYRYRKWGGTCQVEVFLMAVEKLDDQWPEAALRTRYWLPWNEAAGLVKEAGLAHMLSRLPEWLAEFGPEGLECP